MLALLAANLLRRPGRTLLTALGTAVGVGTIVALLGVTSGIQDSAAQLTQLGAADLGVFQAGAGDPTTSIVPTSLVKRIEQQPGVASATPVLLMVDAVPKAASAIVFGIDLRGFVAKRLVFLHGRAPGPGQISVGDALASQLHLRVGGRLRVSHRMFPVTGIYHFGAAFQDGGAVLPLATAQRVAGREGEATTIGVQLAPGVRRQQVQRELERHIRGINVITDAQEAARAGANGALISNAVTVIVVLALLVGSIGVANTMLMAILERRSEFALLSAVGWSGPQIAGMVLAEGVSVSLIGAAIGLLFGAVGASLLVSALGAGAFVSPDLDAWDLGRGLIVGLGIGVLGGLYPSWRVTRLPPAPALARR